MAQAKRSAQIDLLNGPVFSSMLRFAVPVLFSNIFQQLYNTMDTVIVGHTLGETSLAAIGAATPVYDLLIGFALGLGNGLSIVTGRSFGAGDRDLLKRAVTGSVVLGAGISVFITLITRVALLPLLTLLNTPEEILLEANSYISIITLFTFVMFAYNLCAGILRSVGNSRAPLYFLMFSSMLNILLDFLFISGMGMGVAGAAIATVIAQGVSVVMCVIYIFKSVKLLVPSPKHLLVERSLYADLAAQGLSMGFMQCIVAAGSVILQSGINGLGYLVIAGHTAARKLYMFANMPFVAMMTAVNTFVAQNYGADNCGRIKKCMRSAYLFNAVTAGVITLFLLPTATILVEAISGSSESVVLENGALYLRIVGPFYFVLGVLLDTRVALQAIGQKILPITSSVIELVGKILFTAIFIPLFAYMAVIFCEPVIWCVMAAELLAVFWTNPYIRTGIKAAKS